jgi:hypothetical protein
MNWNVVIVGILVGVISSLVTDFDAFLKSRSADSTAKYDWVLAATRAAKGALTGLLGGLGGGVVIA